MGNHIMVEHKVTARRDPLPAFDYMHTHTDILVSRYYYNSFCVLYCGEMP